MLDKMSYRLNYRGGTDQIDRMNSDKLKSLESAMKYSYQSATINILPQQRLYKCLINPDKLSMDVDNKILSIPYYDEIREGSIIWWSETDSYWLVYLRHLEETAYFRASLRRCHHQVELEDGSFYWVYIRGPVEQSIVWQQGGGNYLNKLNNTLVMYITKDTVTDAYFHRFAKVKIEGNTWEVQAVDRLSTPGIIEVALKEDFNNSFAEIQSQDPVAEANAYITGSLEVYPYDTVEYSTEEEGEWTLNMPKRNMVKIVKQAPTAIKLFIATGKSGEFTLSHSSHEEAVAAIKIKSL